MQFAGLQPQVLAPPVGAGDDLAVQRGHRRIEGLEHGQRRDVDAPHGQPDGVAAEVVGKRFDLG